MTRRQGWRVAGLRVTRRQGCRARALCPLVAAARGCSSHSGAFQREGTSRDPPPAPGDSRARAVTPLSPERLEPHPKRGTASPARVSVSLWKQELLQAGRERLQLPVWVGRGNVAVGKCQFVKMETFWQERIHPRQISVQTEPGRLEEGGRGRAGCPPSSSSAWGGWQGWCHGGSWQRQLPAVQSLPSFLTSKIWEKRLKRESAARARRRGLGMGPRSPQPRVWKSWGGPAGGSLGSAQSSPHRQLRQSRMRSSRANF